MSKEVESPPECFICTESAPAPRRSACKCVDRHIHDACLAKMLETTQHARCPVCLAPYANVAAQIRVVGVDVTSRGAMVLGAAMAAVALIGCGVNTWLAFCCSQRELSAREDFVVCFSSILMTSLGIALVAFVGRECVMEGPRALVRSMLVRKRVASVLPAEVALPPRFGVDEFGLGERHAR
jgi:hypothetical protein